MLRAILLLTTSVVVACNAPQYGDGPTSVPPVSRVEAIKLTPQSIHLDALGSSQRLTVALEPRTASVAELVWESTDPTIVSVDASGLITATGFGAGVLITAHSRDGRHEASVTVSVGD